MDVIYTRDAWLHRVDVARATEQPLELTPDHDGRMVADVVRDWADRHGQPFRLDLDGPAGGSYKRGVGGEEQQPRRGGVLPGRFRAGERGRSPRDTGPILSPPDPAPREVRKTVTVLFVDLVGSTDLGERLDAEVLRNVLQRYYELMAAIAKRFGGTVEKFIGDAILAIFGNPIGR